MRINFFEVGKRVLALVFIFVFFVLTGAKGQSVVQSVSYIDDQVRAESFEKNTYGYKIFSSLALNNIKGLKWTYINFKGRVLIQTEQTDDGHIFAYTKLIDYSLTGEDHFRDFSIDSLLVPSALSGTLLFTDDQSVSIEVPVELLLSGGVIDLSEVNISIDSLARLRARIEVEKFVYTEKQWEVFQKKSRLINLYYAYNEILDGLIEKYRKEGIQRNQSSSRVFLAWHEISRINKYISSHEFSMNLNLEKSDPQDFLSNFNKSARLENRANTLFGQVLNLKSKSSPSGKKNYCQGLTELSVTYNKLSELHQPYIASGFNEVVRLFQDEQEFERIRQVADFYDVFTKIDSISTPQRIYDNYIKSAVKTNEVEKFVLTLDLLYNAALISNNFPEIKKSALQNQVYAKTLDGLMSAYLHVAIMAYTAGSFDMADLYYQKAMDIYQLHQVNLEGEALSPDSFLNFIEQQVDLAYGFMSDERFQEGLRLVDQASSISSQHALDYNGSYLDSAYSIGYMGIFKEKLDSIGDLIENTKIDQALSALELAASFSYAKENYINGTGDDELKNYAKTLFDVYFQRGERLMKSRQPENALFSFLDAQLINELYLHENHSGLDSLIYNATVPVILDLINKAEFETWANRMANADSLLNEALMMQEKYSQEDNLELNSAFAYLQYKMKNRVCVNLGNKIFELQKKSENRIKTKKYAEADFFVTESLTLIKDNPDCEIDNSKIKEIELKYQPAFEFAHKMAEIDLVFNSGDFPEMVSDYILADDFYQNNNISKFGTDKPDLREFVSKKKQEGLTIATIDYYIKEQNYEEAFFYLNILKESGFSSKAARDLQESVGKGLSQRGQYTYHVEKYTKGDKWFRYFRSAYLKN